MTTSSRIKIKLPNGAEFDAEGSPDDVKAQYAAFVDLMKATPAPAAEKPQETKQPDGALANSDLGRIFDIEESGLISLKVLPSGEKRNSDALLMLMYGYLKIAKTENIYAVTLSRAAKKSGVIFDRVDRVMDVHTDLVRRGGLRRGATYTLNNQGVREAEKMTRKLIEELT